MTTRRKTRRRPGAPATAKKGAPRGRSDAETHALHEQQRAAFFAQLVAAKIPEEAAHKMTAMAALHGTFALSAADVQRALRESGGAAWVHTRTLIPRDGLFDTVGLMSLPESDDRVFADYTMAMVLTQARAKQPETVTRWGEALLRHAPTAVLATYAELLSMPDLSALETNTLSALGNMVSAALRREILRARLVAHGFNFSRVSDELKMGGAGNVKKLAIQLGLGEELAGKSRPGRPAKDKTK